ncbi:hypothetical protein LK994_09100 [Ferruginibacter lapsinanis]|uniref:hypothetical protein n=1 Tax=Ferruginibacter lapsinanis TaxID=563172 RepID=UPI001E4887FB|nr:hypothetical protein [Ferruginibacter lapsinanis]UEG48792.1 hypothetical protein LK994_09100 [Ferruginibacter lapsinanis]
MYSFLIKTNKSNVDIVIVRAIFAVAATAAFVQSQEYGILGIIAGALLIAVSIFVNAIRKKLQITAFILLIIGIVLLCFITQSPYFALVLVLHWLLERFLHKETRVDIDSSGIRFIKPLNEKVFSWKDIQHVVLKDGLLTIDYTNNHFSQSEVNSIGVDLDERAFNQFCSTQLQTRL